MAEGEERWTDEPEMMVSKARFEEVQTEFAVWKKQSSAQVALAEDDVERAEAERDDLARLLDEAIDREKVREVDLERAQEVLREFVDWFDERFPRDGSGPLPGVDIWAIFKKAEAFVAEARERGER